MPLSNYKYPNPFEYNRRPRPSHLVPQDVKGYQGKYNDPQTRENLSLLATSRDPSVAPSPIATTPTPVAPPVLQQQPKAQNWWTKLGAGGQSALLRSALAAGSAMLERSDPNATNPMTSISAGVLRGLEVHDAIKEAQKGEALTSRLAGISTGQPSAAYAGEVAETLAGAGKYKGALEAFKTQSILTTPEKEGLEYIIAEEERKFGYQKELMEVRTGGAIRETEAGITARTEAAKGLQQEQINQMNQLLDQTDLNEETKQKIKVIAQGGLGASVGAVLFPREEKDRIIYEGKINPLTGETIKTSFRVYTDRKTGKLVKEEIKTSVPEVAAQPKVAPEVPIQPPTPEPEPEIKRLQEKIRAKKLPGALTPLGAIPAEPKVKKLIELKHVEGAPTLEEYLERIVKNPKNVNIAGDIIIPESKLLEDYRAILEAQKAINEAAKRQKALRIK